MAQSPTTLLAPLPDAQPRPFVIEHRRGSTAKPGHFVPEARLALTATLRTSGLLRQLEDGEARTLLALLSFLSAEGRIRAAAFQIADALQVSEKKARERLDRLAAPSASRPQPVLIKIPSELGMDMYALSPSLVSSEEVLPERSVQSWRLPFTPAGRSRVLAHSRAQYARPRAEVEKTVLEQLGHKEKSVDTSTPEGKVVVRLMSYGVLQETAERLVTEYPLQEITNQMDWMGFRGVRSPERFLVAAIRGRYTAPPGALLAKPETKPAESVSLPIPAAVSEAAASATEGGANE